MARYLRDCTSFILNSGDTAQQQLESFRTLTGKQAEDLHDFLLLSPRGRALVKPDALNAFVSAKAKRPDQDRLVQVLLCGSDDDCRFLLKGAKESSRNALRSFLLDGLIVSSQFVTAKKYPDLNRCALVLMNTNAADYVQAEALLAKYYAKEERAFNRVFNEKVKRSVPVSITRELQQVYQRTATSSGVVENGYGYCPECFAPARSRERRIDGDTTCINGHVTKTSSWVTDPTALPAESKAPVAENKPPVTAPPVAAKSPDLTLKSLLSFGWTKDGASVFATLYGEKVTITAAASGYVAGFAFGAAIQNINFQSSVLGSTIDSTVRDEMRKAYLSSVRTMLLASGWSSHNNPQERDSVLVAQRKQFYELFVEVERDQILLRAGRYIKSRYELSADSVTDKQLVDTILSDSKQPMAKSLREISANTDAYSVFETEDVPPKYLVTKVYKQDGNSIVEVLTNTVSKDYALRQNDAIVRMLGEKLATYENGPLREYPEDVVPGIRFSRVVGDNGETLGSSVSTAKTRSVAVALDGKTRSWDGAQSVSIFLPFKQREVPAYYVGRTYSITSSGYTELSVFKTEFGFKYINAALHYLVVGKTDCEAFVDFKSRVISFFNGDFLGAVALVTDAKVDAVLESSYNNAAKIDTDSMKLLSADDRARVFVNDPDILPRCTNLSVVSVNEMRDVIKSAQVELDGNGTLVRPGLYKDVTPEALEAFKRRVIAGLVAHKVFRATAAGLVVDVKPDRVSFTSLMSRAKSDGVIGVPNPTQAMVLAKYRDTANRYTYVVEVRDDRSSAALLISDVSGANNYSNVYELYTHAKYSLDRLIPLGGTPLSRLIRATVAPVQTTPSFFDKNLPSLAPYADLTAVLTTGSINTGNQPQPLLWLAAGTPPKDVDKLAMEVTAVYELDPPPPLLQQECFAVISVPEKVLRFYLAAETHSSRWWDASIEDCEKAVLKSPDLLVPTLVRLSAVYDTLFSEADTSKVTNAGVAGPDKKSFVVNTLLPGSTSRVRTAGKVACNGSNVLICLKGNGAEMDRYKVAIHAKDGVYYEQFFNVPSSVGDEAFFASVPWMRFKQRVVDAGGFMAYLRLLAQHQLGQKLPIGRALNALFGTEDVWDRAAEAADAKRKLDSEEQEKKREERDEAQRKQELEALAAAEVAFLRGEMVDVKYFEQMLRAYNIKPNPRTLGWSRKNLSGLSTSNIRLLRGAKVPDGFWDLRDQLVAAMVAWQETEAAINKP